MILGKCVWGPWKYGECSKSCGGGKRTVRRDIIVTTEDCFGYEGHSEECNPEPCPGNHLKSKKSYLAEY